MLIRRRNAAGSGASSVVIVSANEGSSNQSRPTRRACRASFILFPPPPRPRPRRLSGSMTEICCTIVEKLEQLVPQTESICMASSRALLTCSPVLNVAVIFGVLVWLAKVKPINPRVHKRLCDLSALHSDAFLIHVRKRFNLTLTLLSLPAVSVRSLSSRTSQAMVPSVAPSPQRMRPGNHSWRTH